MQAKMEKHLTILTSHCDHTSHLSLPAIFSLFMDLATEHGSLIGLGTDDLAVKGLFWLTVKTKIRIHRLPRSMDTATAMTWPETPGKVRCNRYYALYDGDELLVEGKTEWAMIDPESGKLFRISDAYPGDLEHCPDTVCEGAYARINEDFSDAEVLDSYRVRSTDIDLGQHMNNAAYPRVFFGAFSCAERRQMTVREVDITFRSPCYEGDTLTLYRRRCEEGVELALCRADGKTAAVMRIVAE